MRVVIDSNVWISALVFGGMPRRIFEQAVENGHVIVLSQEIITEIRRILHQKFPNFVEDFEALLTVLGQRIDNVNLGEIKIEVCRDPDDNKVLETAVIGQASHIVSGDKDLLSLETHEGIGIVTPSYYIGNDL